MKDVARWNEGDWIAALAAVALFAVLAIGGLISVRKREEVAGHPRGLFVLFYAEMWERFSYCGMRALLVLYLTRHWLYDDGRANLIYGAYGALVYIMPVLGGLVADRWLGQRKAVFFGGVLLTLGHLLMAVEEQWRPGRSGDQRVLGSAGVHHRRLGLPQGPHLGDRRPALSPHRRAARRRLHDLLHEQHRLPEWQAGSEARKGSRARPAPHLRPATARRRCVGRRSRLAAGICHHRHAAALRHRHERAAGVFLHVRGEHARTLLDEQLDGGQTDGRRCAGDDGHLPLETI